MHGESTGGTGNRARGGVVNRSRCLSVVYRVASACTVVFLCISIAACPAERGGFRLNGGTFFRGGESAAGARVVHADFDISTDALVGLIVELPESIQTTILRLPEYFIELLYGALTELPSDLLRLVDPRYPLPDGYVPGSLAALDDYKQVLSLNRTNLYVHPALLPDLLAMSIAAESDGVVLGVSSAYRSYAHQESVYQNSLEVFGAKETSETVAVPGHSQHQLGMAVDFGSITNEFLLTPAGRWIFANGWRYGFSLSYPEGAESQTGYQFESWHWRYIGRSAAKLQRYFFFDSQQLMLEFISENRAVLDSILTPINYADR